MMSLSCQTEAIDIATLSGDVSQNRGIFSL
jgi:hypothetical protein